MEDSDKPIKNILGACVAISTVLTLIEQFSNIKIDSNAFKIIINVLLIFGFWYFTNKLKEDKLFFEKNRKMAFLISSVLLLYPVFCLGSYVFKSNIFNNKECEKFYNESGIIIANFNSDLNNDFSQKTYNLINTRLSNSDSLIVLRTNSKINYESRKHKDSLEHAFLSNCYNKGILVFGNRNKESNYFDCSIYLKHFNSKNLTVTLIDGSIIYIQNPDFYNFSIDHQANVIAEFILSLILLKEEKYSLSNKVLEDVLKLHENNLDKNFRASCMILMGNNYLMLEEYKLALQYFETGLENDPSNKYLSEKLTDLKKISNPTVKPTIPEINKEAKPEIKPKKIPVNQQFDKIKDSLNMDSVKSKFEIALNTKPIASQKNVKTKENTIVKVHKSNNNYFDIYLSTNGKYGILTKTGKKYITPSFDSIGIISVARNFYFLCSEKGKWGALNSNGEIIFQFEYKSLESIRAHLKKTIIENEFIEH